MDTTWIPPKVVLGRQGAFCGLATLGRSTNGEISPISMVYNRRSLAKRLHFPFSSLTHIHAHSTHLDFSVSSIRYNISAADLRRPQLFNPNDEHTTPSLST